MSRTLTREELARRAAIDGRVAFAAAAFLVLAGLVALIDRVGAPEGLVRLMGPIFVLAALATIGVLMRSVRVSGFYAAGRAVPAPYVGFAAVAVCAGVTLPFVSPNGQTLGAAASACGGIGFATAVVVVGPYLRKTGAFSAVDALATRFPERRVADGSRPPRRDRRRLDRPSGIGFRSTPPGRGARRVAERWFRLSWLSYSS